MEHEVDKVRTQTAEDNEDNDDSVRTEQEEQIEDRTEWSWTQQQKQNHKNLSANVREFLRPW